MKEKKYEVRTFYIEAYCPHCDIAMERDNVVLTTYPPQYIYTCPKCFYQETSFEQYPRVEYERKEDE